jgi:phage terminase small subunit
LPPQPPGTTVQPLEYMLAVMNDPEAHPEMRARMAVAAAPYVHAKIGEQGKKEQKNEAAKKLASRFGASAPPRPPGSTAH